MFLLTCGVQEEGQYYRHVKHDLTAGWEHSGLVRVLECKQWELWFAEVNTPFFPTPPFFAFSYAWMSRDTVKAQGAKDFQPAHSLSLSPALCLLRPPVSLAFFVKANKTLQSRRLGQKNYMLVLFISRVSGQDAHVEFLSQSFPSGLNQYHLHSALLTARLCNKHPVNCLPVLCLYMQ